MIADQGEARNLTDRSKPCHTPTMPDGPTTHELSERIARLEERMETMRAEHRADMERIVGDQRAANEKLLKENEKLSKELAQRDRALLLAILGMIALAVAILKFA